MLCPKLQAQNSYIYIEGIKGIPFNVISENKEVEKLGQAYAILTFAEPGEKSIDISFANSNFSVQKFIVDVQPNSSYGFRLGKTEENRFYLIDIVNEGSIIETNSAVNLALSTNKNLINIYQVPNMVKKDKEEQEIELQNQNEVEEKETRELVKNKKLSEEKVAKEEAKRQQAELEKEKEELRAQEKSQRLKAEEEKKALLAKEKMLAKQASDLAKIEERKKEEEREAQLAQQKKIATELEERERLEKQRISKLEEEKLAKEKQAAKEAAALAKLERKQEKARLLNEAKIARELQKEKEKISLANEIEQKKIEEAKSLSKQKNSQEQQIEKPVKYGVVDEITSKERAANQITSNVSTQPKASTKRNSNCAKIASNLEIKSINEKIETKGDDEDKLLFIKKKVLSGCFTSAHVYSMAEVFDTQYGRYSLVKFVLPLTSDPSNLLTLESLFKYEAYKSKLRKLVEN